MDHEALDGLRGTEFGGACDGVTYLNHAGTGPMPARAIGVLKELADRRAQPWTIGDHDVLFPALARVRALCGRLIGANPDTIALVPNTSFGLSLAARCLPLERGDVVLTSDKEFPSLVYSWQAVERSRGIRLEIVPARGVLPDEEALIAALDKARVRALAISWVSFATGYRLDVERLGRECRKRGVWFVVDAMQGVGPARFDVKECGADIVACGGYKWLMSPWGTAFLYVRRDLVTQLEPPVVGWFVGPGSEDYTKLLDYDLRYYDDARRFEVMTLGSQDFIAMGASVDLLLELGLEKVEARVRALTGRIMEWARGREDMRLVTPSDERRRAGIVAVAPKDPVGTSQRLRAAGVIHSLREGAIRLSPYFYNTDAEIDRALAVLGA